MKYPNGVLVEYDDWVYKVTQEDVLTPLVSWSAALSWNQPILAGDEDTIEDNYDISPKKLGFRPSTVVKSKDQDYYYIDGKQRRKLDKVQLRLLGFNEFEILEVEDKELDFHPIGDPIV